MQMFQSHLTCFWPGGGSRTQHREPTQTKGEHARSYSEPVSHYAPPTPASPHRSDSFTFKPCTVSSRPSRTSLVFHSLPPNFGDIHKNMPKLNFMLSALRRYLVKSEHHQLDGSSQVPLLRHGAAQRLHGHVIGAAQQRLAVHRHQLIVDSQSPVLMEERR